jgi:cation transport ATPase
MWTAALVTYFFLVNMIFPVLPFLEPGYMEVMSFPSVFGIYSLSVIFNFSLTVFVMYYYARPYVVRSYANYRDYGETNMETLIALGSMSAFGLALFFIVRYTFEAMQG